MPNSEEAAAARVCAAAISAWVCACVCSYFDRHHVCV